MPTLTDPRQRHEEELDDFERWQKEVEDEKLRQIEENYGEDAPPEQEDGFISKAAEQLRNRESSATQPSLRSEILNPNTSEQNPMGYKPIGKAPEVAASTQERVLNAGKRLVKIISKNKTKSAAIGGGAGALIGLALFSIFFIGISPVAFMKVMFNDLLDHTSAMTDTSDSVMKTKLKGVNEKFVAGCASKMSVMCRLKSMSEKDALRLKANSIEVVEFKKIGTRIFPKSYKYKGGAEMDAEAFAAALKNDKGFRLSVRAAMNMKFFGTNGPVADWMLKMFGTSRAKSTVDGNTEEEKAAKLKQGDVEKTLDLDPTRVPDTPDSPDTPEPDPKAKAQTESALKFTKLSVPEQFVKTASITGMADLACTAKNMVGAANVTAKVVRNRELVQYAMKVIPSISAIMAGTGTEEDGRLIGRFFNDQDLRREVVDMSSTFQGFLSKNGVADVNATTANVKMKANPNYGNNVMSSSLYALSSGVGTAKQANTADNAKYALGMSPTLAGGIMGSLAGFLSTSWLSPVNSKTCAIVQNWLVRGAGLVVGILAMFTGAGEVNWANNIAMFVGMMVLMFALQNAISAMANGGGLYSDIDQDSTGRAAAFWTGAAGLSGSIAQGYGLQPGSKSGIVDYKLASLQTQQDYIALERQGLNPFDSSSPYSFISTLASNLQSKTSKNIDFASQLTNIFSLVSSAPTGFVNNTALASTIDSSRFEQCDSYKSEITDNNLNLNIDPDVQCNIRFVENSRVKGLIQDPEAVVTYMQTNGFADENTALPSGYTEPDAISSGGIGSALLEMGKGIVDQFVSTRYIGMSSNAAEYAQFLDWCVYRTAPYGPSYEESSGWGAAPQGWLTGENCTQSGPSGRYDMFRAYRQITSSLDITESPSDAQTGATIQPVSTDPNAVLDATSDGWTWPIAGATYKNISLNWGVSASKGIHKGIDIPKPEGTPVLAATSGTVVESYWTSDCGGMIRISVDGSSPARWTTYQHTALTASDLPKKGSHVTMGQVIGHVGKYCGSGFHLHFGVEVTDAMSYYSSPLSMSDNPLKYLPGTSVPGGGSAL